MTNIWRGLLSSVAFCAIQMGAGSVAMAQDASEAAPADSDEVVVTARRVSESQQNVPIPLTALSGDTLEAATAFTPLDLSNAVPNVKVFRGAGNSNTYAYFIRGIGRDIGYFYAEAPVALYVDDVFYPYHGGPVLNVGGINRVEVLRGPQGTLYGRNSTVGTVKIYSDAPNTNTEDRSFSATVGEYGRFEATAGQNFIAIEDRLAFRADLGTRQFDGFLNDIVSGDTLGGHSNYGARLQALYTPNAVSEFRIIADGSSSRDESVPWTSVIVNAPRTEAIPRYGDRYNVASHMPNVNNLDAAGVSFHGRLDLSEVELRSITSYRGFHQDFANDNTSRADNTMAWNRIETHDNSWTQEFVATGDLFGDRLSYVAGLFYFESATSMEFRRADGRRERTRQHSSSVAEYLDLTFALTDNVNVSGGVRFTQDEKDVRQLSFTAAGVNYLNVPVAESWDATTTRFGIDYRLTPNFLIFANYGEGFKGGSLNTGQPTVASQVFFVPPEQSENREIGFKSEWFNGRLRLNMNYFDTIYQDQAQTILNTVTGVSSVAFSDARADGYELEILARPIPGLEIGVQASQLEAVYQNVQPGFAAATFTDLTLKHAPDHMYNFRVSYGFDFLGGELTLGGNYEWLDEMYESLARDVSTKQESYELINVQATYDFPDPSYQMVFEVTNVADTEYFVLGATGLARQYGPPRQATLTFRYRM